MLLKASLPWLLVVFHQKFVCTFVFHVDWEAIT